MGHPDPRWCARINAHRRPPADAPPPSPPPLPAGSPYVPRPVPAVHECEICGAVMFDHSCKIVCPNCGYRRDCSDP